MNTASILILCAFVYLAFVTWMFRGKGKKHDTKTGGKKETQETASDSDGEEPKKNVVTVVPQSDFDFDKFREVLTESMAAAMTYVLNAKMGDVNPQDVEFKKSETDSSMNGDAGDTPTDTDTADDTPAFPLPRKGNQSTRLRRRCPWRQILRRHLNRKPRQGES